MTRPIWLLDVDGVINAITRKPDRNVWPADQWEQGKAQGSGREWPILWARPVVDFIRTVHESGRAEIRWHTTWQREASAIATLVGLPEFAVAESPEYLAHKARTRDRHADWWKLPAAERVVRDEVRPLIWTDDDITWSLARYDVNAGLRTFAPSLLVSPSETTGLTPKHLRQIGDFLDLHAPELSDTDRADIALDAAHKRLDDGAGEI